MSVFFFNGANIHKKQLLQLKIAVIYLNIFKNVIYSCFCDIINVFTVTFDQFDLQAFL